MEDFCVLRNPATAESVHAVPTGKKIIVVMTTCKDITKKERKAHCLSLVLCKCFLIVLEEYQWEGIPIIRHPAWKKLPSTFVVNYPQFL